MTYVAPTTADLTARYPEFAAVPGATLTVFLSDAISEVGSDWIEADRAKAQLALAAHFLSQEGLGESASSSTASSITIGGNTYETAGALSLVKLDDAWIQFGQKGSGSSSSGSSGAPKTAFDMLATTPYGLRYLELLYRSFPAVAII